MRWIPVQTSGWAKTIDYAHTQFFAFTAVRLRISIRGSVRPSVHLPIHQSVHPSVCPSVRLLIRPWCFCKNREKLMLFRWNRDRYQKDPSMSLDSSSHLYKMVWPSVGQPICLDFVKFSINLPFWKKSKLEGAKQSLSWITSSYNQRWGPIVGLV